MKKAVYRDYKGGVGNVYYITNVISQNCKASNGLEMFQIAFIEGKGYYKEIISECEAIKLIGEKVLTKNADGSVGVNSFMFFIEEIEKIEEVNEVELNENLIKELSNQGFKSEKNSECIIMKNGYSCMLYDETYRFDLNDKSVCYFPEGKSIKFAKFLTNDEIKNHLIERKRYNNATNKERKTFKFNFNE